MKMLFIGLLVIGSVVQAAEVCIIKRVDAGYSNSGEYKVECSNNDGRLAGDRSSYGRVILIKHLLDLGYKPQMADSNVYVK